MFLNRISILLGKMGVQGNPVIVNNVDNKGKEISVDDSAPVMREFCNGEASRPPCDNNVDGAIVQDVPNEGADGSNFLPHDAPYVVEIISDLGRVIHAAPLNAGPDISQHRIHAKHTDPNVQQPMMVQIPKQDTAINANNVPTLACPVKLAEVVEETPSREYEKTNSSGNSLSYDLSGSNIRVNDNINDFPDVVRKDISLFKNRWGDEGEEEFTEEYQNSDMQLQTDNNGDGNFEVVLSKSQKKKQRQKHKNARKNKNDVYINTRARAGSRKPAP